MSILQSIPLDAIRTIAYKAGDAIMQLYNTPYSVIYKEDHSPLTEADTLAHNIISQELLQYELPILSEESEAAEFSERQNWDYYWCIDPIDGTKEFIKKNGEFTVNIALIHKQIPVLGVVYAPAIDAMYSAKQGSGAYKNGKKLPLHTNPDPKQSMTIVTSRSHPTANTLDYIESLEVDDVHIMHKGSSLKLVMVAEGSADIYPRLAPTMEWDTAAADAIVREAGKMTYHFNTLTPLLYNKASLLNPAFIVK